MDNLAGTAMRWNVDAIKEPRGFIKFIEFIIAIFAFATTTSSSSSSSFSFVCNNTRSDIVNSVSWSYPFSLDKSDLQVTLCNGTIQNTHPFGNFAAPSQFYVFVGVMAFLYCIAAVVLYVCFDDKYRQFNQIPIFDFCATCAFVLMWLISSSAWATGVDQLKQYANPDEWRVDIIPQCHADGACETLSRGNFAGLNVSLIFGFLNMAVWAGNLWFLYKETKWYNEPPQPAETPNQAAPETPQI